MQIQSILRKARSQVQQARYVRGGFTLVEMLISVAIMLMLMAMFAEVFQLAGSTITSQRGIAENDQRSRAIQTLFTADFDKRSFRMIMPWNLGENQARPETNNVLRKGYFYISENDPTNDVDDFIQFTIDINDIRQNTDISRIYGRATAIPPASLVASSAGPLGINPNQPEADDGWAKLNSTAETTAAEVCYFVRNGKLFRRAMLLRLPLLLDGASTQPTYNDPDGTDRDMFDPNATIPAGGFAAYPITGTPGMIGGTPTSFWNEFDSSAFYYGISPATPWAHFHGVEDLANTPSTFFPMGKPMYRFGHRVDTGRSREFDANGNYFGRFTQEETSHPNFRFPQGLSVASAGVFVNPMTDTSTLAMSTTDFVFPSFRGGPRRGEDLLLSNVHSFDVKVWDQNAALGTGAFVDIGGATAVDYSTPVQQYALAPNTLYGPTTAAANNRVFDTWYPYANVTGGGTPEFDLDGDGQNDPPPYRLLMNYPPSFGRAPVANLWQPNTVINVGDLVFPTAVPSTNGYRFCYRCVGTFGNATTGATAAQEPSWPTAIGSRVLDPTPALGGLTNGVLWEAFENWKPLKAIQITIRFLDTTSQQMRQLTIVHSLVD